MRLDLRELAVLCADGLTKATATVFAECASVCMAENQHPEQVRLALAIVEPFHFPEVGADRPDADGVRRSTPTLVRLPIDDVMTRTHKDNVRAAEDGAYGVALLIGVTCLGLKPVERSRQGTGFDWWLGPIDDPNDPFAGRRRLEVSGLNRGSDSEFRKRVRQKKKQTTRTASSGIPALVAVVDFGQPRAIVETML